MSETHYCMHRDSDGRCINPATFFSGGGEYCPDHTPAAIGYGVGDSPDYARPAPPPLTPEQQRQVLLQARDMMAQVVWLLDQACHGTERPAGRLSCLAIVEHTNAKRLYYALKNGAR